MTPRLLLAGAILAALPVMAAPDQRTAGRASPEFLQILDDYRRGDAEAAANAFAEWKAERVETDAVLRPATNDYGTMAALALLHTEAGMKNHSFGEFDEEAPNHLFLGDWGLEKSFEVHSYTAARLIDSLAKHARAVGDDGLAGFCRSWYVLSVSYCLRWGRQCMGGLLSKSAHFFKDDAESLLLLGAAAAAAAGPRGFGSYYGGPFTTQLPMISQTHGEIGPERQTAEWALKKALDLDPSLIEARLRLGRLYHLLDRDAEAEPYLADALARARDAGHLFVTHLAAFFLGELREEQDRLDDAIEYYRMAIDVYPRAHTAAIALGQALIRRGAVDEGWQVTRRMFDGESEANRAPLDPYAIYRAAQLYQGASRVEQMRRMVRQ